MSYEIEDGDDRREKLELVVYEFGRRVDEIDKLVDLVECEDDAPWREAYALLADLHEYIGRCLVALKL